jgi:hypothetical protein
MLDIRYSKNNRQMKLEFGNIQYVIPKWAVLGDWGISLRIRFLVAHASLCRNDIDFDFVFVNFLVLVLVLVARCSISEKRFIKSASKTDILLFLV